MDTSQTCHACVWLLNLRLDKVHMGVVKRVVIDFSDMMKTILINNMAQSCSSEMFSIGQSHSILTIIKSLEP